MIPARVSILIRLASVLAVSPALAGDGGANNLNPENSLCLDLRGVVAAGAQGACQSADSDCLGGPPGGLQCSDNDLDPLNGAICVERACYHLGDQVVVDVELGPTDEPACGAQIFVGWDTDALAFDDFQVDPDGEFGWSLVLLKIIDDTTGMVSLAVTLPVGMACNATNGSIDGGTIARLTLVAVDECETDGAFFIPNNPPTSVASPGGQIDIVGCNGADAPSGSDPMTVSVTPPVWQCPQSSTGNAACVTNLREVHFPPITVVDPCQGDTGPVTDLCTVQYFPACDNDGNCEGTDTCTAGTCDAPVIPSNTNLEDYLDGGGFFLPGRTEIRCSAGNGCGDSAVCDVDIVNTGLNRLVIDLEMSPLMVPGDPEAPITRCMDFALSDCDVSPPPTFVFTQDVVFGEPFNIPGHGTAAVEVPPADWRCVTVADPFHSLSSTCDVACVDGDFRAVFKGPPEADPVCHWLVQGNLDGSPFVDIADFTIVAGQYLSAPGASTPCGDQGHHADINGDGVVTIADFAFVIVNFFDGAPAACEAICSPAAESRN